ncbi:T9SS type A sorting domain-containing protein [Winogradskyella rapida]|uniref:T9SS type A sorting domain-containing protein n=1 Tax=Winogradskyella rapida TaxID=549701 RepID=A0ABW3KL47_9FLAO
MKQKLLILLFFISAFSFAQVASNPIEEFTISPNPAKTSLNISLPHTEGDLKLEVFNVLGKRVYSGVITKLKATVNVSNWKNGVYLVRVSDDKTTQTKRFIKQ